MLVLNCAEETNEKSLEKLVQRAGKEAIQWGMNHTVLSIS
jgi:hypothetical protein